MALRTLRLDGDEILRKKSKVVKHMNASITTLLDDMLDTMNNSLGIGLAAPQIGVLKRIAIVDISGAETDSEHSLIEMINPEIIHCEGEQSRKEGCLSVPGVRGTVLRPSYIQVKYLDRHFRAQIIEATELLAVAICHEIDHLDGILYIDKIVDDLEEVPTEEGE